jgi:hypothetical protein
MKKRQLEKTNAKQILFIEDSSIVCQFTTRYTTRMLQQNNQVCLSLPSPTSTSNGTA